MTNNSPLNQQSLATTGECNIFEILEEIFSETYHRMQYIFLKPM